MNNDLVRASLGPSLSTDEASSREKGTKEPELDLGQWEHERSQER